MVIVLLIAVASGYQQQQKVQPAAVYQQMRNAPVVGIVRSVNEAKDDGSFNYGFVKSFA